MLVPLFTIILRVRASKHEKKALTSIKVCWKDIHYTLNNWRWWRHKLASISKTKMDAKFKTSECKYETQPDVTLQLNYHLVKSDWKLIIYPNKFIVPK